MLCSRLATANAVFAIAKAVSLEDKVRPGLKARKESLFEDSNENMEAV